MEKEKNEKQKSTKSRVMTLTIKAVVLNEKKEVLILKRSKSNKLNPGKYDLPGGHIEEEESFVDSVIREIKEEVGLDASFGEIIDVVEFPKGSVPFSEEKRGLRCICYVNSNEIKLSHEHEDHKWIVLEKAAEKFSSKDGFENEKRETILKAVRWMDMKNSLVGWQRTLADFENYKKRQAGERRDLIAFSNLNLILEILPILDNFYASTKHIPEGQKENPWTIGIMHIQKQLGKVLEDNGVIEIEIKEDDKFDPAIMEAVESKEKKDGENKNRVKKVLIKGYKIGGKVIRAAKVIVE